MNSPGSSFRQEWPEPEGPSLDDNIGIESANDPAFFEKFAEPLAQTRATIEGYKGTEEEKEILRKNVALFNSILKNIDGPIGEAEGKDDFRLSKSLKALRTSLRFEVEEINNKNLI